MRERTFYNEHTEVANGVTYVIDEIGTLKRVIREVDCDSAMDLFIPDKFESGGRILSIASCAFRGKYGKITISNGIENIEDHAFFKLTADSIWSGRPTARQYQASASTEATLPQYQIQTMLKSLRKKHSLSSEQTKWSGQKSARQFPQNASTTAI